MDFTGYANPLYLRIRLNNGLHEGIKHPFTEIPGFKAPV